MRIGLVTAWYDCGAGYVSKAYEEALASQHAVFILARSGMKPRHDPFWNRPNVTWGKEHACSTGVNCRQFSQWVRSRKLDAVIFNEQRHWQAVIVARQCGVIVGAYVDYYTADTAPMFHLYDFLICNTRRHYSVFRDHPQVFYVPWGTDCRLFSPQPRPERPLTFFHSAGLRGAPNDRKGTGPTLAAFRRVAARVRLVVHSQLPLQQCPLAWRQAVGDDPRIEFRVETAKPPGLYHLGDVYVYPSRLDGIGLTVPEAQACGLAAIVPDHPPMNEFVMPETGILLPIARHVARQDGYYWPEVEVDVADLAAALQEYADQPDKALAQGLAAREHAVANLNWSSNARPLPSLIAGCHRLAQVDGPSDALMRQAQRHDRLYNPTLVQRWLIAHWRIIQHGRQRLSSGR